MYIYIDIYKYTHLYMIHILYKFTYSYRHPLTMLSRTMVARSACICTHTNHVVMYRDSQVTISVGTHISKEPYQQTYMRVKETFIYI